MKTIGEYLLVSEIKAGEKTTAAGLVLPESSAPDCHRAKVLHVGERVKGVKKGDVVRLLHMGNSIGEGKHVVLIDHVLVVE